MAHYTEKTITVNLPADKIWQVLDDFSSVERFAATIQSSPIIGDITSGLGTKRKCTFHDGSSLVEEIIEYRQNEKIALRLSDYTLPLKSMQAEIKVTAIDDKQSELFMSTEFEVKAGPLGWLLGQFLMRPMMKSVFKNQLAGLAYHCATGRQIDKKMPAKEELTDWVIG
ncbi:SRPBCC family protein [Vibrio tapetis]|uniref:SRPBCC family protein n=1 Tax=Vibrio tapetis subsp. tapetis TaxID=1671868 RepID=A0A2N8ZL02_9VIBR|nr:SRPBCC family protein [Vibrio tapetis]SON52585.1 conserved protein of unknown function [Vibrio tapetis subsp. tapetis]